MHRNRIFGPQDSSDDLRPRPEIIFYDTGGPLRSAYPSSLSKPDQPVDVRARASKTQLLPLFDSQGVVVKVGDYVSWCSNLDASHAIEAVVSEVDALRGRVKVLLFEKEFMRFILRTSVLQQHSTELTVHPPFELTKTQFQFREALLKKWNLK